MNTTTEHEILALAESVARLTPADIERLKTSRSVNRNDRIKAITEASRLVDIPGDERCIVDLYVLIQSWSPPSQVAVIETLYALLARGIIGVRTFDVLTTTLREVVGLDFLQ
jgi:hypothetical protein